MILFCWRDGAVATAEVLPRGAIELARGGEQPVRALLAELRAVAADPRHPCLCALAQEPDDERARQWLRAWMWQYASIRPAGPLAFNHVLDLRFVGAD
ncbi:MAG: hypothetical protein LCH70_03430 [Proteobacteria bacterium]|nr:hypothetical protein [Pseudomonadota bacterium]